MIQISLPRFFRKIHTQIFPKKSDGCFDRGHSQAFHTTFDGNSGICCDVTVSIPTRVYEQGHPVTQARIRAIFLRAALLQAEHIVEHEERRYGSEHIPLYTQAVTVLRGAGFKEEAVREISHVLEVL